MHTCNTSVLVAALRQLCGLSIPLGYNFRNDSAWPEIVRKLTRVTESHLVFLGLPLVSALRRELENQHPLHALKYIGLGSRHLTLGLGREYKEVT